MLYASYSIKEVRHNNRGHHYYLMSDDTIWTTEMDTVIDPYLRLPQDAVIMTCISGNTGPGQRIAAIYGTKA
jgi:hypothetical protein